MKRKKSRTIFFHPMNDYTGSTRVLSSIIADEYGDQEVAVMSNFKYEGFLSNLKNVKRISFWAPKFRNKYIPVVTTSVSRAHLFLLTLCYGWKYDIFYINTFKPEYAAIVGRLYRKQIVYHIHEKYISPNLGQRFSEYVFNHARAKKIFVSEYLSKQYPRYPGSEYVIKYNKLSKDFLAGVKVTPIDQRKRNSILFIGSLGRIKGVEKIVPLAKNLPEFYFVAIFSAEKDKIMEYFGDDIPSNLILYSKQPDIHTFLEKADLMINLSNPHFWIETFGMTILESMAYGIPSIAPNVGGPVELVVDGYNGYCVDTTDIEAIKNAIVKALSAGEYERLCENTNNCFVKFK